MHWNSVARHAVVAAQWDCTSAADLQAIASAADLLESMFRCVDVKMQAFTMDCVGLH